MTANIEEWPELSMGATTATYARSGTSVIRRLSVSPHAWVGPTTNWSQSLLKLLIVCWILDYWITSVVSCSLDYWIICVLTSFCGNKCVPDPDSNLCSGLHLQLQAKWSVSTNSPAPHHSSPRQCRCFISGIMQIHETNTLGTWYPLDDQSSSSLSDKTNTYEHSCHSFKH